MSEQRKICASCSAPKPETAYTPSEWKRNRPRCKACVNARVVKYYAETPTYREARKASAKRQKRSPQVSRRHMLKHKYGLTEQQYDALLAEQAGGCALCGSQIVGTGQWVGGHFHVDHDHGDGHVRGLLCQQCNTQLGGYEALLTKVGEVALLDYLTRPCPIPAAPPPVIAPEPEYHIIESRPYVRPRRELGVCSVEGCEKDEAEAGLCSMHYARRHRTGATGPAHELVRGAKGAAHPKSKLTEDNVRAIRASDERGIRLAEHYGVTATLISNIRLRKVWRHVA